MSEQLSTHMRTAGAVRRSLRRHLFVEGLPDVDTAAIRSVFDMALDRLDAASFTHEEALPHAGCVLSSIDLELVSDHERLLICVNVHSPRKGAEAETYNVRVVHSANPLGDAEYETTNVYLAEGNLTEMARALFRNEQTGLEQYAREHLTKAGGGDPFNSWQYQRENS
ncbi:hypothetical protein ACQPT2_21215 [Erwinia amylovora]